jgi:hypothetical protein
MTIEDVVGAVCSDHIRYGRVQLMKRLVRALIALCTAVTVTACSDRASESAPTRSPVGQITVGRPGVAVHHERFGVGAIVHNGGPVGVRDVELSIRFIAGDEVVLTDTDVLAFCPRDTMCPWGTSYTISEDQERSIDSAEVRVARVGPTFDDGVIRQIDLRITDGSVSFELPPRQGVTVLYAARDDGAPYFGVFITHPDARTETLRLRDSLLPVGPQTRGVFYEGHVPDTMKGGGD